MQLDLTPSLFDSPLRSIQRRSVRVNANLRPLPKHPRYEEQYSSANHIHYDYSLTETSPTPLHNAAITGTKLFSPENTWKRYSLNQHEHIKNLIFVQKTDRSDSNSQAFEAKMHHSAAFGTPSGHNRSASVEPMFKKLNMKKKAELISSPLMKRDFSPQKRVLPAISSEVPGSGSGFTLHEPNTVREKRSSESIFKISSHRSTSIEPSAKRLGVETLQNSEYKERILKGWKVHLENHEVFTRSSHCTQPDQAQNHQQEDHEQQGITAKFQKTKSNARQLSLPDTPVYKEKDNGPAASAALPKEEEVEDEQPERNSPSLMFPRLPVNPSDLVFGPNVKEEILRKHIVGVIQGARYAVKQVKVPAIEHIQPKQISLQKKDNFSKTLVLDLDETLITTRFPENKEKLPSIDKEEPKTMKVKIRPYAEQFLKEMSQHFEIIVFTAAEKRYAETCLKLIDPNGVYVKHLLHRENCLRTRKGLYIKDLRIIKNRELKDMVLVDNFTPSFSFQIGNGIPIITWEDDVQNKELKYLMRYLLEAKNYDDMREINQERFRLEELAQISLESLDNM